MEPYLLVNMVKSNNLTAFDSLPGVAPYLQSHFICIWNRNNHTRESLHSFDFPGVNLHKDSTLSNCLSVVILPGTKQANIVGA